MKRRIEARIFQIENQVSDEISENYVEEIVEVLKKLGGDGQNLSGSGRKEIWKILKKKYPKCETAVPIGKKDKSGNIVSNHEGLKDLYLNTYMHRLRNRPVKKEYEDMKAYKDDLFDLRMKLASLNKSLPWEMEDLELVLKNMKEGKSRDPNGWVREIFSNEVAGTDLKKSMLKFFNKMKTENYIPEFVRKADVTTIYKGKGEKFDLENDRGIFLVTTFRSILMKLI